MNLSNYTKVRFTDSKGLNGETAWAYGMRKNLLTGEIKKYSDFAWIAKKYGYSEQDIELYFG